MEMFNIYLPIAQTEFNVLLLIAIGFCVGVLGGFFGVGGAWIVTPALNIFGFPMAYAIGTDFAHIFGKSIVATKKHGKMGNVDWKLGFTIPLGTILGVETRAQIIMALEAWGKETDTDIVGSVVRWTYIIMLFSLSAWMMYDYFVIRKRKDRISLEQQDNPSDGPRQKTIIEKIRDINIPPMISFPRSGIEAISIWVIIFIFFFAGLISGFLGVGGGFVKMPTMVYLLGCPTALAVGTDLFVVMLDGAYGCFTYALKGRVELFAAIYVSRCIYRSSNRRYRRQIYTWLRHTSFVCHYGGFCRSFGFAQTVAIYDRFRSTFNYFRCSYYGCILCHVFHYHLQID